MTRPCFARDEWTLVIVPTRQWRLMIRALALASFCPTTLGTWSPGARSPESNETPSSEVTVCFVEPLFVQQTVVPGAIVRSSGVNEKSAIAIIRSPGPQAALSRAGEAWPEAGTITSKTKSPSESRFPIAIGPTLLRRNRISQEGKERPGRSLTSWRESPRHRSGYGSVRIRHRPRKRRPPQGGRPWLVENALAPPPRAAAQDDLRRRPGADRRLRAGRRRARGVVRRRRRPLRALRRTGPRCRARRCRLARRRVR